MSKKYGLGRVHIPDNRDYKLDGLVDPSAKRANFWQHAGCLDQGQSDECTSFSAKQWLLTMPIHDPSPTLTPDILYAKSQALDSIPLPHSGSTIRATFQALQNLGYVGAYSFTNDTTILSNYVLETGPIVIGVPFLENMYNLKDNTFDCTGKEIGGHAMCIYGVNLDFKSPIDGSVGCVRIVNSWGNLFGYFGQAWMSIKDLGMLLAQNGEACTATKLLKLN